MNLRKRVIHTIGALTCFGAGFYLLYTIGGYKLFLAAYILFTAEQIASSLRLNNFHFSRERRAGEKCGKCGKEHDKFGHLLEKEKQQNKEI